MRKLNKKTKKIIISYLYVTIGVIFAAFSFSFFLNPNNIVIGGVSGLGIIFKEKTGLSPSIAMTTVNVILLIIGLITIGKDFFLKTVYGSITFPIFSYIFDQIYLIFDSNTFVNLNNDLVLVILFSSIIMGYGLGLCVKHGGSTGGSEIPQKIMYEKIHLPYSFSLYIIDGSIIALGYFLIKQDIRVVLYEVIFMVLLGFVMDIVIFGGLNKRCVHIISDESEKIKTILIEEFNRGVTGINVIGEYTKKEKKLLVCLLSVIEYNKLRELINKIDPVAFVYCVRASEVRGEGFTYELHDV